MMFRFASDGRLTLLTIMTLEPFELHGPIRHNCPVLTRCDLGIFKVAPQPITLS